MSTTAISGQYGSLHVGSSSILEILDFKFDRKAAVHSFGSSKTGGYKENVVGVKSGTFTCKGQYDPAEPPEDVLDVGDTVTVKAYISAAKYYTIPITIESISISVDLNEGQAISFDISAVVKGSWSALT